MNDPHDDTITINLHCAGVSQSVTISADVDPPQIEQVFDHFLLMMGHLWSRELVRRLVIDTAKQYTQQHEHP